MKNQIIKTMNFLLLIIVLQLTAMLVVNTIISGISFGTILASILILIIFFVLRVLLIRVISITLDKYYQRGIKEGMQTVPFLLRDKFYMKTRIDDKGPNLRQIMDDDIRNIITRNNTI